MHPLAAGLCLWLTSYCSTRVKKGFREDAVELFATLHDNLVRVSWAVDLCLWWQRLRELGGLCTACERGRCAHSVFALVGCAQNRASCAVDHPGERRVRFHCGRRGGADGLAEDPMAGISI
jgi:hypothetical protein